MAVFTKLSNKIVLIKADDTKKFISKFNQNKVSKEFLESCKKAGRLFNNKKSTLDN